MPAENSKSSGNRGPRRAGRLAGAELGRGVAAGTPNTPCRRYYIVSPAGPRPIWRATTAALRPARALPKQSRMYEDTAPKFGPRSAASGVHDRTYVSRPATTTLMICARRSPYPDHEYFPRNCPVAKASTRSCTPRRHRRLFGFGEKAPPRRDVSPRHLHVTLTWLDCPDRDSRWQRCAGLPLACPSLIGRRSMKRRCSRSAR